MKILFQDFSPNNICKINPTFTKYSSISIPSWFSKNVLNLLASFLSRNLLPICEPREGLVIWKYVEFDQDEQ